MSESPEDQWVLELTQVPTQSCCLFHLAWAGAQKPRKNGHGLQSIGADRSPEQG